MTYKRMKRIMHIPSTIKFFFSLTLLCSLLFFPLPSANSQDAAAPAELRAGYIFDGDYMYKTPEGDYRGYDVEYLYTLAQEANWHITFVDYTDSEGSLKALYDNDIDILMGMSRTPEREAAYLFSDKKMVTSYMTLMVRPDDLRYTYGDTPSFAGMTTAARRGAIVVDIYKAWCAKNNLEPHLLLLDDYKDALQALLDGRADGMVVGGVYAFDQTRTVAQFSPSDSFFMISPNRQDLKKQLDDAMERVLTQSPLYELSLSNKYFDRVQGNSPLFTPSERDFISSSAPIRIALLKNAPPYSYMDSDGQLRGAVAEYYQQLAELSGLKFSFVAYENSRAAARAVQQNEADILSIYAQDIFHAVDQHLALSVPYGNLDLVMVSRSSSKPDRRYVVSVRDADMINAIGNKLQLPHAEVLPLTEDCFRALRTGQADAVLCDMQVALWFLNQERVSDYSIVSLPGSAAQIYSAANADKPMLHNVLNKTIIASNNSFSKLLVQQSLQQDSKIMTFLNRIPRIWAIMAALISILVLILVIAAAFILLHRRKAEARLSAQRAETERKESAVKAAEKANLAKFNFFSNLSHDMRTPLNGIIGFTDLAIKSDNTEKIRGFLSKIKISGHLMLDLVNDMLTISRLENGKFKLNPEPVTVSSLLKSITVPIEVTASQAGIDFRLDADTTKDYTILADMLNIQKIFLNLLSNSMKFTPSGKAVTLRVRTEPKDAAVLSTCISVMDEGSGISPDFLPHIFDAFSQETMQGIRGTKGSGLGLNIVRHLVELMNGTIEVSSEIGKGTCFIVHIDFPIAENAFPEQKISADEFTPDELDAYLKGKSILVCEDNELNMEIIQHLLMSKQIKVTGAANGQEGMNIFRENPPYTFDAILMDNRMPVMNGIEAAKAIRALVREDAGTIPIIALTADVFPEETRRFLNAGMNAYLAKPIDPSALYAALAAAALRHR